MLGEECERAKPFPDPYLVAAEKLGLQPADPVIVIEDSPSGVRRLCLKFEAAAACTALGLVRSFSTDVAFSCRTAAQNKRINAASQVLLPRRQRTCRA